MSYEVIYHQTRMSEDRFAEVMCNTHNPSIIVIDKDQDMAIGLMGNVFNRISSHNTKVCIAEVDLFDLYEKVKEECDSDRKKAFFQRILQQYEQYAEDNRIEIAEHSEIVYTDKEPKDPYAARIGQVQDKLQVEGVIVGYYLKHFEFINHFLFTSQDLMILRQMVCAKFYVANMTIASIESCYELVNGNSVLALVTDTVCFANRGEDNCFFRIGKAQRATYISKGNSII